jgi:hypothetical protein
MDIIADIEHNNFKEFNNTFMSLLNNLKSLDPQDLNNVIIVDNLVLLNQSLFELSNKFNELNYDILKNNVKNLSDEQVAELKEYEEFYEIKKKYIGLLAVNHLLKA